MNKYINMHFNCLSFQITLTPYIIIAVVTGATDGLGKAYAEALGRKGISIVLISRTKSKLTEVAQYLGWFKIIFFKYK